MKKKSQKKKSIAEYDVFVQRKLGGGAFGVVFEAINRNTKEKVACKMIQKSDDKYSDNQLYMINSLKRQSLILSKISSDNVVGFKQIMTSKRFFYIFQQLCQGDLRHYLAKHKAQPEEKAIQMMTQLLNGFYALIITNVIHRDIKPENILIKNNQLKLADFGLSRRIGGDQLMTSHVGTRLYSSPQIIQKNKYTSKCDIYSLGLVFYEILYNKVLLSVPQYKILQQMKYIDENLEFPIQPIVSQQLQQIIRKCLKYNEEDRADWHYLFNHPLFKDHVPNLEKLNMGLQFIISTIRQQIEDKNIDLQKYFKKYNLTDKKQIGFDEYTKVVVKLTSLDKVTPEQIRYSFNFFDKDKSGKISFEQFRKTLQNFGVQMNAVSRDQLISKLIKQIKNEEQQQGLDHIVDDESFSPEQLQLFHETEAAYQKMLIQIKEKKIADLQQKFQLVDLLDSGLKCEQFAQFLRSGLKLQLTKKQCELIFNKMDDDKNEKLEFQQYYRNVCKEVNIPVFKSEIIETKGQF